MAEPHAQRALALAELVGDQNQIAVANTLVAFLRSLAGDGLAVDQAEEAVANVQQAVTTARRSRAARNGCMVSCSSGRTALPEALRRFEAMRDEAIERGDEQSLPFVLFHLARTELLLGNWLRARAVGEACAQATIDSGQQSERPFAVAISSVVRAHLGDVDVGARRDRERARARRALR